MICDMCPSITMPFVYFSDFHGVTQVPLILIGGLALGYYNSCAAMVGNGDRALDALVSPWFPQGDLAFKGGKKPSETSTGGWYPLISMSNHFKIEGSSFCLGLPRLTFEGRNAREPTVSLLRRRCHLWTLVGGLGPCHSDTHDSPWCVYNKYVYELFVYSIQYLMYNM